MAEAWKITFLDPYWLVLLPLVWALMWLFFKRYKHQSMWEQFCDKHLLDKLIPSAVKTKGGTWLAWVLTLVLSLAALALAGPSWRNQSIPLFESAAARVVVLDLSRSMLAEDVKPTRFKRAVFKAKDLIRAQQDGQTALIAFAGAAFVVSPLTDDKKTLFNFLDSLKPDIMPVQGSRIDLSLSLAQKILSASLSSHGEIFVLTDGVSELQAAMDKADEARDNGNRVSIIAFGTAQGGPLKDSTGRLVRDEQGKLIIAKVGFDDLQRIADQGGGRFSRMTASNDDINLLLSGFGNTEIDTSSDSQDRSLQRPVNDGVWLVWLMLPLALILFRKNAFWALVILAIAPFERQAYALDWSTLWKNSEQRAYQAYQQGHYDRAQQLSSDPMLKGSAYYKSEDYGKAESSFAQNPGAGSFYNRGNALAHQQQFEQALAAYDRAIQLEPGFTQAIENKRLIEEFLKQQQNQQNKQQNQDDKGAQSSDESADQSESNQSQSDQAQSPASAQDDELQSDSDTEQWQQQNQVQPEQLDQTNPREQELAMDELLNEQLQNPESIDRWIHRLPDDPSELLRRKFLRDYQRQRSQP